MENCRWPAGEPRGPWKTATATRPSACGVAVHTGAAVYVHLICRHTPLARLKVVHGSRREGEEGGGRGGEGGLAGGLVVGGGGRISRRGGGVGSKGEGDGRREGEGKGERDEVEWKFGISMEKKEEEEVYYYKKKGKKFGIRSLILLLFRLFRKREKRERQKEEEMIVKEIRR